jgi:hypothetical protein
MAKVRIFPLLQRCAEANCEESECKALCVRYKMIRRVNRSLPSSTHLISRKIRGMNHAMALAITSHADASLETTLLVAKPSCAERRRDPGMKSWPRRAAGKIYPSSFPRTENRRMQVILRYSTGVDGQQRAAPARPLGLKIQHRNCAVLLLGGAASSHDPYDFGLV